MTVQHTPGPWEVESPMPDELWIVEAGKQAHEWRVIAGSPFPGDRDDIPRAQVKANARLMAASPVMLEALKLALPWLSAPLDDRDQSASGVAHRAVVAAIALAEAGS
jgi:hypothetical protein